MRNPPRMRFTLLTAALLGSGGGIVGTSTASIPPEIPLLQRPGNGARALGLGGAYVAVANDYHALAWNPAGLAELHRIEFGGALEKRTLDTKASYLGRHESTPLNRSRVQSLGFAYPFPTYRGSVAIGLSYERTTPLDQDYYRKGSNQSVGFEEESILEDGSLNAWRAGFAFAATEKLSLGVSGALFVGSSERDRRFEYRGTGIDRESTHTQTTIDYLAVSGTLGALAKLSPHARFGIALHLPEHFTLDGTGSDDIFRVEEVTAGGQSYVDSLNYFENFFFEDEVELPFRIAAGLAVNRGPILLTGDLTFADWQEVRYAGPLRTDDRGYAYRATTDLRVGGEWSFTSFPLSLRAGFASTPVPYNQVGTDIYHGRSVRARFSPERRSWSAGASYLVDPSMALEVALVSGTFERSGSSPEGRVTTERYEEQRIYLGTQFRL